MGRSTAHRREYIPAYGASNASQLRPLEWAGQAAGAERLRDVAGTRLLKRQTPHPLALPHIKDRNVGTSDRSAFSRQVAQSVALP